MERYDIESIVQILPEIALFDLLLQVGVGGGYDAHIKLDRFIGADPLHLLFLQHPQKFGLKVRRHGTDLIQEDSPMIGALELAGLVSDGPGEGAAHMAEQFAFQQGFRDGAAVDRNERL